MTDFSRESHADRSTPLDPDEAEGLIPDLLTRGELNTWEQANILKAEAWAFAKRRSNVLTRDFVVELHRRMFDETWVWAGELRRSDKSIGVYWATVLPSLQGLLDDTQYWIAHNTYHPDELLARFHHRLVSIHPFPNGNGRHARLIADLLAAHLGLEPLTWGRENLAIQCEARTLYLAALRQADRGSMSSLIQFLRS